MRWITVTMDRLARSLQRFIVREKMEEICSLWGIELVVKKQLLACHHPLHGAFRLWRKDLDAPPLITMMYAEDCPADILWWAFVHELSHVLQWIEVRDFGYRYFKSDNSKLRWERDCWKRTREILKNSIFPVNGRFFLYMDACLESYKRHPDRQWEWVTIRNLKH